MKNKEQHNNYNKLFAVSTEIQTLKGIERILLWDQETYMPFSAIEIRTKQAALLCSIIHKKQTSKLYADLLKNLINLKTGKILATTLSPEKKIAIKEWYRTYTKLVRLPKNFVERFSTLTSKAKHAWAIARKENDFHKFRPFLEQIVTMCRKKAELLTYEEHPYDALLDEYEPGCTTAEIELLFSTLKKSLINFLKLMATNPKIDDSYLLGYFDKNKQLEFSQLLLKKMGYDLKRGRLDLSEHPFTISLHPTDVRLTTSIDTSSLMPNIYATIHEGGHGLYELGLPQNSFGSPLCEPISSGIHESQSRLWEACIGQSLPFWKYFFPKLKKQFPDTFKRITLKQFYAATNKINPGPIRITADEATYNLHIILRFEIEKALIEGTLSIKDLPEAWNDKMKQYLNITVNNNAEGCLQDIHWSMGAFGYFPTYTLGNLYAAQLFATIKKQYPNWEEMVAQGNLTFITQWLNKNIFRHGKRYSSRTLIKKITGKQLTIDYFTRDLYNKYQKIYHRY